MPPAGKAKPAKASSRKRKSVKRKPESVKPVVEVRSEGHQGGDVERPPGLTDREWLFCHEYLTDLNATQAAIRAGYAATRARQEASELRAKGNIAQAISKLIAARTGATTTRILDELARIGFADIRKVVRWRPEVVLDEADDPDGEPTKVIVSRVLVTDSATLDDDTAAAVASVSQGANGVIKITMHDKVGALEKIARALGMFKETQAVNVDLSPTIILTGRPDPSAAS